MVQTSDTTEMGVFYFLRCGSPPLTHNDQGQGPVLPQGSAPDRLQALKLTAYAEFLY